MARVELIFALHNHQPVGNFDHVFEDAYQRAYAPLLQVLAEHPPIRACLHQSGVLWEWIEARHPEFLHRVRALVQRGQLELLAGGHYEPILSAIPEADRQGQMQRLGRYLEDRFGQRPRGAWLAERVWEPHLAESLARAGLSYTVVDDSHFVSAGWSESELLGPFVTEENGRLLHLFPIAKKLRYLLPFAEPEESIAYARRFLDAPEDVLLVHADDGEKFGIWPGTHERCYTKGWLEKFFALLEENADWLHLTTFSDSLNRFASRGRIYLPTASYSEMMEWALPAPAQPRLRAARQSLDTREDAADLQGFVRGGFWRNFLARYPESNWMHKRMLRVSRLLGQRTSQDGFDPGKLQKAAEHLWRGQCNCAYWHGLFGGLYLPHLRSAVYEELIRAETLLQDGLEPAQEVTDFDVDGRPELLLHSPQAMVVVKPDCGGAVYEFDDRRHAFNVLDLLTRRYEAYHDTLRQLGNHGDPAAAGTVSIHDLVHAKEPDLQRALVYDRYRRGSCIDHLLPAACRPQDFEAAALPDELPLWGQAYDWRWEGPELRLECSRSLPAGAGQLVVGRRMQLQGAALHCHYEVLLEGQKPRRFGVELAANLLAGQAPDRWIEADGTKLAEPHLASRGPVGTVQRLDLVDAWRGLRVVFECSRPLEVWRAPIETVSTSESGFERVYQGSAFLFLTPPLQAGSPCAWTLVQRVDDA